MASYIESSLGRSERIVYKAQVSWLSQFWGDCFWYSAVDVGNRYRIDSVRGIECNDNRACFNQQKGYRKVWLYPPANN